MHKQAKIGLLYLILCIKQTAIKQKKSQVKPCEIYKKQIAYLSVSNLSIIFVTKWHSICIIRATRHYAIEPTACQ